MTVETFSGRRYELVTIVKTDEGSMTWDSGFSYGRPAVGDPDRDLLVTGTHLILETVNFSRVTGMLLVSDATREAHRELDDQEQATATCACGWRGSGETRSQHLAAWIAEDAPWLFHKSDQELEREHQEYLRKLHAEREQEWQEHQVDWRQRELALPMALQRRLARFRANGGHGFETDGWGYELMVCELAVLYRASGGEDDEQVMAFAEREGTTGNQHSFAQQLAKLLSDDDPASDDMIANSVSALTPLTGDPDYSKAGE